LLLTRRNGREASGMVILSPFCLIAGVALAWLAPRPIAAQQAAVEATAGSLVIIGLFLIGTDLPLFR
jgi:hypothetical protein